MAADQAARLEEAEARRPDYFKRTKRPNSTPSPHANMPGNQENAYPGLGVIDSPVKGRRLALFQETSEESFEQSLLAGGYPLYGHAPAYAEPTTPTRNGKLPLANADDQCAGRLPTEKDLTKQRRLAAFRDHNTNESPTKLIPVTLEGIGRVLLDHLPTDSVKPSNVPQSKKGARKRKGSTLEGPAKKSSGSPSKRFTELSQVEKLVKPNWPDQSFPWSLQSEQRVEYIKMEEEERLRCIERYLDRESDEDEDSEDQSLGLPRVDDDVSPVRRGRGKMVPIRSNRGSSGNERAIPSDPADARAALLSKRSVRALAFRRRKDTLCICQGEDGGGEQVQCDECHKWYHLECIGIRDISELGKEEDPWYCDQCLGVTRTVPSSPIFAPTDDRLPVNSRRDSIFFPLNVQESPPALEWNTALRFPRTPQGKDQTRTFSTRSSMGDSSQFGPETPSNTGHSVRVYNTPGPTPFLATLDEPYDPTSTPSRGMKFSGPFTTPRPPTWYRGPHAQTPLTAGRKPSGGSFPFTSVSRGAFTNDESPVRRATKPSSVHIRPPESPLAPRSTVFPVLGLQQSRRSGPERLPGS
ncbi:hypothetical protein EIP86_009025 [Pleurotus ostreatoroseus]|nr:hypothetical protein EIP86_009025 [Pleurotus ostreatoroseus]